MTGYYSPREIIYGNGCINNAGIKVKYYADSCLAVFGASQIANGTADKVLELLKQVGVRVEIFVCPKGEPTNTTADDAALKAKNAGVACCLAVGGGSAIDIAKAAAGLATNGGKCRDYLEGVGNGSKVTVKPLPVIAVPTTAGTGAEATKNAVITGVDAHYKKSFRHQELLPVCVLIDPELQVSVPKAVTANCGMDAVTQLLESLISAKGNAFSNAWAMEGLKHCISLKAAYDDGTDLAARGEMALAALYSGMALANGGLGAAHGFASGLGAYTSIPHGLACAIMLPHVLRLNKRVSLAKLALAGRILTGKDYDCEENAADAAIKYIDDLCAYLAIPKDFKQYGISTKMAEDIVKASMGGSMTGNPVPLDENACLDILKKLI